MRGGKAKLEEESLLDRGEGNRFEAGFYKKSGYARMSRLNLFLKSGSGIIIK